MGWWTGLRGIAAIWANDEKGKERGKGGCKGVKCTGMDEMGALLAWPPGQDDRVRRKEMAAAGTMRGLMNMHYACGDRRLRTFFEHIL